MRIIVVFLCITYWLCLTVLLLYPRPADLVGLHSVQIFPWGKFGIHTGFFIMLGVLANFSRWPKGISGPLLAFLMIYGVVTETLQLVVPPRTPRVMDGLENLLGIAIGTGIYWAVWRLRNERKSAPVEE
jgi:hypothetical protein